MNKSLETYLRCMCSEQPTTWSLYLALAEWSYNTALHSAIQCTPNEVVYGQAPPLHLPYLPGESKSVTVDRSLSAREEALRMLKFHLNRAQNRMKQYADARRTDREFKIGDYVLLKLQPYRQFTMRKQAQHKLSPKYFGPYKIVDRIGKVAYQLELPPESGIHNVIHVSQLKFCPNPAAVTVQHPAAISELQTRGEPESILARKMVKRGRIAATKVLVKWKNKPAELAKWEFYYDLLRDFPHFHS